MKAKVFPMFIVLFLCACVSANADPWHVDASRPDDSGDGSSWAAAKKTIQAAIDLPGVIAGDTIWVTNGVYATGGKRTVAAGLTTNRAAIDKAITVASVNGPSNTFIVGRWHDGWPGHPTTTNRFGTQSVRCAYLCEGSALIGFTLTNGASVSGGGGEGGGIWCAYTNGVTISNCVLTANSAERHGGGAWHGAFYSCVFAGNLAVNNWGGAAHASVLHDCVLTGNTAGNAGGGASQSVLYDCVLSNNIVTWGYGGGVYGSVLTNCIVTGSSGYNGGGANNSRLYNCVVNNNSSTFGGGGLDSTFYSCSLSGNSGGNGGAGRYSKLYSCSLTGNSGPNGGGGQYCEFFSCSFTGNYSPYGGGGHSCVFYSCEISGNSAGNSGGAAAFSTLFNCLVAGNSSVNNAGGLSDSSAYNCVIAGNSAYNSGGGMLSWSAVSVVNSIVYSNAARVSGNDYYSNAPTLMISFQYSRAVPLPAGPGDTDADPMFIDPGSGYGTNHVAGNYRLKKGSRCMNNGLNLGHMTDPAILATNQWLGQDIEGGPRIRHNSVDMGAYELRAPRGSLFSAE